MAKSGRCLLVALLLTCWVIEGRGQARSQDKGKNDEAKASEPTVPTVGPGDIKTPKSEIEALLAFKKALNNVNKSIFSRWKEGSDPCGDQWPGVECGPFRVRGIEFSGFGLKGRLVEELANLESLEYFSMPGNSLTGPLPASWGSLGLLKKIDLQSNDLTGTLPESWSSMFSINQILLDSNKISGELPSSWWRMPSLQILSVPGNKLKGPLPPAWGNMQSISVLILTSNRLTGTLPQSWGGIANLQILRLGDNQLVGPLPSDWGSWRNIKQAHFQGNSLVGSLPDEWDRWTTVSSLRLDDNNLAGPVPGGWSLLSINAAINLSNNPGVCGVAPNGARAGETASDDVGIILGGTGIGLPCPIQGFIDTQALLVFKSLVSDPSGKVLSSWKWKGSSACSDGWKWVTCKEGDVISINLSSKGLGGQLSGSLSTIASLRRIELQDNDFGGSLPPEWGKLSELKYLNISFNKINGILPGAWGDMKELQTLDVANNSLIGDLPSEWGRMENLRAVNLNHNALAGSLPFSWSLMTNLETVKMQNNILTGALPPTWANLTAMKDLVLAKNELVGMIPAQWAGLLNLEQLDFEGNKGLCGEIPKSLPLPSTVPGTAFKQDCPITVIEAIVLTTFKTSVGDPRGLLSLWKASSVPCQTGIQPWSGILCQRDRVAGISLPGFGLTGPIPPEILNELEELIVIDFSENKFTGTLPASWSGLAKVKHLNLSNNALTGLLPAEWSQLTQLEKLDVSGNDFEASVPESWVEMEGLTLLDASENGQMCGDLPGGLGPNLQIVSNGSALGSSCTADDAAWVVPVFITVAGLLLLIIIVLSVVCCCAWKRNRKTVRMIELIAGSMPRKGKEEAPRAQESQDRPRDEGADRGQYPVEMDQRFNPLAVQTAQRRYLTDTPTLLQQGGTRQNGGVQRPYPFHPANIVHKKDRAIESDPHIQLSKIPRPHASDNPPSATLPSYYAGVPTNIPRPEKRKDRKPRAKQIPGPPLDERRESPDSDSFSVLIEDPPRAMQQYRRPQSGASSFHLATSSSFGDASWIEEMEAPRGRIPRGSGGVHSGHGGRPVVPPLRLHELPGHDDSTGNFEKKKQLIDSTKDLLAWIEYKIDSTRSVDSTRLAAGSGASASTTSAIPVRYNLSSDHLHLGGGAVSTGSTTSTVLRDTRESHHKQHRGMI